MSAAPTPESHCAVVLNSSIHSLKWKTQRFMKQEMQGLQFYNKQDEPHMGAMHHYKLF